MLSWTPSLSKIGTSSSIDRHQAASLVSAVNCPPQQFAEWPRAGDGPRPNSEFIVSTLMSTAT
jgi:hypothetical protein